MPTVYFRFYAELNDFLPPERRTAEFPYSFNGSQSIKHLIEAVGVPHTEVDLILANGTSVGFSYVPHDLDRITVYPVFEAFDIATLTEVRSQPLRRTRFVLDAHLGRLAVYLRMLGFDTLYRADYRDDELARVSLHEHRVLLTRDRALLMRRTLTHGYYVRHTRWRDQVVEIVRRFDLADSVSPLTRCLVCNELLVEVAKGSVADRVPARSLECSTSFWNCGGCGRVYWDGSHFARMTEFIRQVVEESRNAAV